MRQPCQGLTVRCAGPIVLRERSDFSVTVFGCRGVNRMLSIIGAGFGRTGTMRLTLAHDQLGLGPCHQIEDVFGAPWRHVALWTAAAAVFAGCRRAVDWPTAAFVPELLAHYPGARVILTARSPESWERSFRATILRVVQDPSVLPPGREDWHRMMVRIVAGRSFGRRSLGGGFGPQALIAAFAAHEARIRALVPPERLLVFFVAGRVGATVRLFGGAGSAGALSAVQRSGRVFRGAGRSAALWQLKAAGGSAMSGSVLWLSLAGMTSGRLWPIVGQECGRMA